MPRIPRIQFRHLKKPGLNLPQAPARTEHTQPTPKSVSANKSQGPSPHPPRQSHSFVAPPRLRISVEEIDLIQLGGAFDKVFPTPEKTKAKK